MLDNKPPMWCEPTCCASTLYTLSTAGIEECSIVHVSSNTEATALPKPKRAETHWSRQRAQKWALVPAASVNGNFWKLTITWYREKGGSVQSKLTLTWYREKGSSVHSKLTLTWYREKGSSVQSKLTLTWYRVKSSSVHSAGSKRQGRYTTRLLFFFNAPWSFPLWTFLWCLKGCNLNNVL